MKEYQLQFIPPDFDFETRTILKKTISANKHLAELKGVCETIPNKNIIINTLSLQEAKDSSAIENIITTHDEIYKEELFSEYLDNAAAKEVRNYNMVALQKGRFLEYSLRNRTRLLLREHWCGGQRMGLEVFFAFRIFRLSLHRSYPCLNNLHILFL